MVESFVLKSSANKLHSIFYVEATCAGIFFNSSSLMVNYEPLAINGRFEPSLNGRFSVNTVAKFSCDRHQIVYHLVGESTSICQKNGEWKTLDQSPQCGILKNYCIQTDSLYLMIV